MILQIKTTNKQNFFSRNYLKILIVFLAVLIFIFIFRASGFTNSFVQNALSPFLNAGKYIYGSLGSIPKAFSDKNDLLNENEALLEEMENSRILMVDYESLKYENQKLREELSIKPLGSFIAARVLARPPQIPLDSIFIDSGLEDGVKNGDLVLAGERTLIGKIAKASRNRSTVALNSFADTLSYGYVDRTEEPIEVKGDGGGSIEATVSIDFDIAIGDKIIVNGSASFIAAVVRMIEDDNSSGFKKVLMILPVDVSKTNIVFVEPSLNE